MSTEELIAAYPIKEPSQPVPTLLFLGLILLYFSFSTFGKTRTREFISLISMAISLIFLICSFTQSLDDTFKHSKSKSDWRTESYLPYISNLELIEENVTDYTLNVDGSITAIAVAKDSSMVTYEGLDEKKLSTTGKDYVSYVYVSGLQSIGIPDGKETLTIHLKPAE